MQDRAVIHLNITDFAVAVERVQDSSLRNRALIVAPAQASRALVYDMSEEAYKDGVRKGMRLSMAQKYCRRAQVLISKPALYRRAMGALLKRAVEYTPLVEGGLEDGHLFLDVTGTHRLFGPAPDIAWCLRKQFREELGLDPVWSLASNKLVAKVSSRLVRPFGEYIVGYGEERSFLAPLPLAMLPGVYAEERRLMADFNLSRIGDLANLSLEQLRLVFQKRSRYLYDVSRGRDYSAIVPGKQEKECIVKSHIFERDTVSFQEVQATITMLVHEIGRTLRQRKLLGRRIRVVLHFSDGEKTIRQATSKKGSDNDFLLRRQALTILDRAWGRRIRIRGCALICDRFLVKSRQQTLFVMEGHREQQQKKILSAMDSVCHRFGDGMIRLGTACIT